MPLPPQPCAESDDDEIPEVAPYLDKIDYEAAVWTFGGYPQVDYDSAKKNLVKEVNEKTPFSQVNYASLWCLEASLEKEYEEWSEKQNEMDGVIGHPAAPRTRVSDMERGMWLKMRAREMVNDGLLRNEHDARSFAKRMQTWINSLVHDKIIMNSTAKKWFGEYMMIAMSAAKYMRETGVS